MNYLLALLSIIFPHITGAYNPVVTQATIRTTICVSGWTSTVRPPESYTEPIKIRQIAQLHYTDHNVRDYEEDHFIPLELGGSPKSLNNLWPEPHTQSYTSDTLENKLKREVCSGSITLYQGRKMIAAWKRVHG